jgi:uncharacterized protein YjbI with pentapeptide repeats
MVCNAPTCGYSGSRFTDFIATAIWRTSCYRKKSQRSGLREVNAFMVDLSGATLSGATLREASLTMASLTGANLSGAGLSKADLSGANLSKADLRRANLREAELSGADMTEAKLENAKFCKTIMPDDTMNNRDCSPKPALLEPSETPPAPN